MAIKDVEFDILLKSTERQFQFQRDVVFTNDRNSVRVIFNIKDMTTSELSRATAQVLLYMRDGSFYQIPNGDVQKSGSQFSYVLKGNEGKHRGVVKAQLIVMFAGNRDLASRKCEFEIDTGLDNIVATEVMIKDWTTLLKEANQYIDDFVENEATRQQIYEQAEAARQSEFDMNESTRQSNENARLSAEEGRASAENLRVDNENERLSAEESRAEQEQSRVDAEALRVEQFQDMQLTQNLDNGKAYKTTLEISGGMPRLKLEEV